jgi:hypothetical protein
MSSPSNMKTGRSIGNSVEDLFPETFFIIYLVLSSILNPQRLKIDERTR